MLLSRYRNSLSRTLPPMTRVLVDTFGCSLSVDWVAATIISLICISIKKRMDNPPESKKPRLSFMPTISKLWTRIKTWLFTASPSSASPLPLFLTSTYLLSRTLFCLFLLYHGWFWGDCASGCKTWGDTQMSFKIAFLLTEEHLALSSVAKVWGGWKPNCFQVYFQVYLTRE